jgi:hypothetical protein
MNGFAGRGGTTGNDFGGAGGSVSRSSRPVLRSVLGETARRQDHSFLLRPFHAVPPLRKGGAHD